MSLTALGFLLLYFSSLLLAFIRRPIFGLYAYLLTIYMHPPGQWWGKILPDLRWSLLAALVTLIAIIVKREKKDVAWFKYAETKLFAIFAIFVSVQSLWVSDSELHSEYAFLSIKFLILIMLIQRAIVSTRDLVGFIVINLIGCAYFGYRGYGGGTLENLGTAGFDGSNLLAQHMGTVLVFSSFLLVCQLGNKKWLMVPALALALNGVILTESRTTIIALAISGLFAFLFVPQKIRQKLLPFMVLGGLAFSILLGPRLIEKMETLLPGNESSVKQDRSAGSRMVIIKSQFKMFAASPLVGHGHRGTLKLSTSYIPTEYMSNTGLRASHNLTMSLLVDHGLIGTVIYIAIIILCISKIRKVRRLAVDDTETRNLIIIFTGLIASLVCIFIAGQGTNNKVIETDIWLFGLIPLVYDMINQRIYMQQNKSREDENLLADNLKHQGR